MIKRLLFYFLFSFCAHSSFGQEVKDSLIIQGDSDLSRPTANGIISYSTRFYTTTIISIPCESFFNQFSRNMVRTRTFSRDSISTIEKFLAKVKYKKGKEYLDTRAKVFYVQASGMITTICMDMFSISVDGRVIKDNPPFQKFLRSLIPKEQLLSRHH